MQIRKIVTGFMLVCSTAAANAQGFVDFSDIPGVDAEPMVEVNITPFAISIAQGALRASDPQTADLLSKLRGIQVRAYNAANNTRQINNFIDNVTEDLEDDGWERVVTVQDEASRVRVLARMDAEQISGVTVMVVDNTEAFFVNIDATVTTEDLGRILAHFELDQMLRGMPIEMQRPMSPLGPPNVDQSGP